MDTLREIDDAMDQYWDVEAIIRRAASRSESYEETADRIRDDHPNEAAEIDKLAQQWHDAEGDGNE